MTKKGNLGIKLLEAIKTYSPNLYKEMAIQEGKYVDEKLSTSHVSAYKRYAKLDGSY